MPPKKVRTPIKSAAQPLIRSWDGRSADAATLRVIVENGVVAGMQPKEIMKAYPCFQKYEGSTFRSALTNIRNSVNKAISNRASYCNTGKILCFLV